MRRSSTSAAPAPEPATAVPTQPASRAQARGVCDMVRPDASGDWRTGSDGTAGSGRGRPREGQAGGDGDDRGARSRPRRGAGRSEEHTSELQSLMRISYAVFCLKKKKTKQNVIYNTRQ